METKADKKYSVDDLNTMYQNMLADRFHLKFHIETKEANALCPHHRQKRQQDEGQRPAQNYDFSHYLQRHRRYARHPRLHSPSSAGLLGQNLQQDERPVVDMTGLTGFYDFTLSFLPQKPLAGGA